MKTLLLLLLAALLCAKSSPAQSTNLIAIQGPYIFTNADGSTYWYIYVTAQQFENHELHLQQAAEPDFTGEVRDVLYPCIQSGSGSGVTAAFWGSVGDPLPPEMYFRSVNLPCPGVAFTPAARLPATVFSPAFTAELKKRPIRYAGKVWRISSELPSPRSGVRLFRTTQIKRPVPPMPPPIPKRASNNGSRVFALRDQKPLYVQQPPQTVEQFLSEQPHLQPVWNNSPEDRSNIVRFVECLNQTNNITPGVIMPDGSVYRGKMSTAWVIEPPTATLRPEAMLRVSVSPPDFMPGAGWTNHPKIIPHPPKPSTQVSNVLHGIWWTACSKCNRSDALRLDSYDRDSGRLEFKCTRCGNKFRKNDK